MCEEEQEPNLLQKDSKSQQQIGHCRRPAGKMKNQKTSKPLEEEAEPLQERQVVHTRAQSLCLCVCVLVFRFSIFQHLLQKLSLFSGLAVNIQVYGLMGFKCQLINAHLMSLKILT